MGLIPGNTGVATTFPDGFLVGNGSVTAPTFRFQDTGTGFYRPAVNQWALSSNGIQSWLVDASGNQTILGTVSASAGSVSSPSYRFGDTGTGFYRKAADSLGIAAAGVEVGSVSAVGKFILGSATATTSQSLIQGNTAGAVPVLDIEGNGTAGAYVRLTEVGVKSYAIGIDDGTTTLKIRADNATGATFGTLDTTGAWTLGPISAIGGTTYAGVNIVGRTNGTAVSAGYVGETLTTGNVGAGVTVTTGTPVALNTTALTVTPGVWKLSAVVSATHSVGGISYHEVSINTVNNALGGIRGDSNRAIGPVISATGIGTTVYVELYIKISINTSYYITAQTAAANSTSGGMVGTLVATRIA